MSFELKITSSDWPQIASVSGGEITINNNQDGTYQLTSTEGITHFTIATSKKDAITKVEVIDEALTSLEDTFKSFINMTEFIAPSTAFANVVNFSYAWGYSSKIVSFPQIDTSSGTDFSYAWGGCNKLKSFPSLTTTAGTNFNGTWLECYALTSFPGLDFSNGTSFNATWNNCTQLKHFPVISTQSGTSFRHTWRDCSSLDCLGAVNTTSATDTTSMFENTTICRPNATERAQIEATPGIDWVSDVRSGMDCCTQLKLDIKVTSSALPGLAGVTGGSITVTDNSDGTYQLTSMDAISTFMISNNDDKITKIEIITEELTSLNRTFKGCIKLTEFIASSTAFGLVTDFSEAWYNCEKLISFPIIDTSKGTNFYRAWFSCSTLTSFPLLDTSSGTNFSSTWHSCSSVTSFPLIDTSKGTNFSYAWASCGGLSSFPLIDTSEGTFFEAAWRHCGKLASFPSLDTSKGTEFVETWDSCGKLTSFPALDTSKATNFSNTWIYCSGLKCMKGVNTTSATNTTGMFSNTPALCRPNATERTAIEATPGIAWVTDIPDGEDCCTWTPPVSMCIRIGKDLAKAAYIGDKKISTTAMGEMLGCKPVDNTFKMIVTSSAKPEYRDGLNGQLLDVTTGTGYNEYIVQTQPGHTIDIFPDARAEDESKISNIAIISSPSVTSFKGAFHSYKNLISVIGLDTTNVVSVEQIFMGCSHLYCIEKIDTTSPDIIVSEMFSGCDDLSNPTKAEQDEISKTGKDNTAGLNYVNQEDCPLNV